MTGAYIIMGVSGCGKSSIGAALARAVDAVFIDGDDLHPPANIAKMAAGTPLGDDDRTPWLRAVGATFTKHPLPVIIGCSALKRSYRAIIDTAAGMPVTYLYLNGSRALIAGRMAARTDHFMPTALLGSQFAALEVPQAGGRAIHVSIDQTPQAIVAELAAHFQKE